MGIPILTRHFCFEMWPLLTTQHGKFHFHVYSEQKKNHCNHIYFFHSRKILRSSFINHTYIFISISIIHVYILSLLLTSWHTSLRYNWPNLHIPECTCSISHNAPFRTEMCAFCSEWSIVGYGAGAFWDLWDWSITSVVATLCDSAVSQFLASWSLIFCLFPIMHQAKPNQVTRQFPIFLSLISERLMPGPSFPIFQYSNRW